MSSSESSSDSDSSASSESPRITAPKKAKVQKPTSSAPDECVMGKYRSDPCYGRSNGCLCLASAVRRSPLSCCLWQEYDRERNALSFGMGRAVQPVPAPRMPQDLGFVRLVLTSAMNLAGQKRRFFHSSVCCSLFVILFQSKLCILHMRVIGFSHAWAFHALSLD